MRNIDRLREYVKDAPATSMGEMARAIIAGMADEIEREVKELTDERDLLKRQWEAGVDFDQRLESCADKREDVTLFGVDYMAYPLDADGEPIHIGDVMEERSGHTFEAASLMAFGGSDNWLVLSDSRNFSSFREPHDIRHHHAPTVEDVLADMFAEYFDVDGDPHKAAAKVIAEYAAKLRLAGEE